MQLHKSLYASVVYYFRLSHSHYIKQKKLTFGFLCSSVLYLYISEVVAQVSCALQFIVLWSIILYIVFACLKYTFESPWGCQWSLWPL